MLPLWVNPFIHHYGYVGLGGLLALGIVGLPVPDETLLVLSGVLVHKGDLSLLPTLAAAFTGSALGITLSYLIGQTLGLSVLHQYGRFFHLTPQRLERAKRWSERSGKWLLMFGYFIPGIRHVTAILAGAAGMRISVFCLFSYVGAAVWCTTFVLAGVFFGEQHDRVMHAVHGDMVRLLQVAGMATILALAGWLLWRRWQRRHGRL